MLLGRVVGTVVATRKEEELIGLRFLHDPTANNGVF